MDQNHSFEIYLAILGTDEKSAATLHRFELRVEVKKLPLPWFWQWKRQWNTRDSWYQKIDRVRLYKTPSKPRWVRIRLARRPNYDKFETKGQFFKDHLKNYRKKTRRTSRTLIKITFLFLKKNWSAAMLYRFEIKLSVNFPNILVFPTSRIPHSA